MAPSPGTGLADGDGLALQARTGSRRVLCTYLFRQHLVKHRVEVVGGIGAIRFRLETRTSGFLSKVKVTLAEKSRLATM